MAGQIHTQMEKDQQPEIRQRAMLEKEGGMTLAAYAAKYGESVRLVNISQEEEYKRMKKTGILFLLLLCSCEYYDNRLQIVNQTGQEIAVETYSDTIPEFPSRNKTPVYWNARILRNDTMKLTEYGKNGWVFALSKSRNRKLNLIVYNIDSLLKYESIDTLIKKRIYKRYEQSEDELNKNNWIIVVR